MSDQDRFLSPDDPAAPTGGGGEESSPARRAGSVTLRGESPAGPDAESLLDPANQSLADALRIMLRLLQLSMVVLAVLYVLSGFQSVKEGNQAIRLLFGSVEASDLDPGFQWSAPYPLGELVKVEKGYKEFKIDKDFWVYVPEGTVDQSPDKLAPTQSLKPDQGGSGSVITGDGNIAHTKWTVGYHREEISNYAQNILPDEEEKIVRAAAKRAIVRVCGEVTIDDLLRQSSGELDSIKARARQIAQESLNGIQSGIVIDQIVPEVTIPPLYVRADFARAQTAVSQAAKEIEQARTEGNSRRNQAAGEAADYLIAQIDAYEAAVAKNDDAAEGQILARIDAALMGEPVTNGTRTVKVSGDVTSVLSEARRYRSEIVSRRKGDLARYEAKLEQFSANPLVMVQTEWLSALKAFYGRDSVQIMLVPPGSDILNLMINADPDILRDLEKALKLRQREEAEQQRRREEDRVKFDTNTSATVEAQ